MGLVDAVVAPQRLEAEARQWALERPPVTGRRPCPLPERLERRAALFRRARIASILDGELTGDEQERRVRKRVRARAPLALRYAEEIIEQGAEKPLAEGLRLELSHLEDVFTSEDALEGMRSAGGERRPTFRGR
jgi:enoyl-CoA hydratase/carnithine racemase